MGDLSVTVAKALRSSARDQAEPSSILGTCNIGSSFTAASSDHQMNRRAPSA